MEILSGDEARKLEPNLSNDVTLALNVPSAGIVCPYELTLAAMGNAMDNETKLLRNFKVISIEKSNDVFTVTSEKGDAVKTRYLINCAGGFSD